MTIDQQNDGQKPDTVKHTDEKEGEGKKGHNGTPENPKLPPSEHFDVV